MTPLILYLGARLDVKTSLFRVSSDCDPVQDPTFGPGCAILHSWEKSAQRRCKSSVGYHLHELSLQSEAGKWCKMKPVQSELSIICTFALLYFAILYMKCSFVTCSWNYIHMLSAPSKYFQNLHCPMQGHLCVSLFQGFLCTWCKLYIAQCETLCSVAVYAVLKHFVLFTVHTAVHSLLWTMCYALYIQWILYSVPVRDYSCTSTIHYALYTSYALSTMPSAHYASAVEPHGSRDAHISPNSRPRITAAKRPPAPEDEDHPDYCQELLWWWKLNADFLANLRMHGTMAMVQIFYTFARFSAGREPGTY